MKKINRKGMFFTVIAVFLVSVLLTMTAQQGMLTLMQRESSAQTRVELADSYVKDLKHEYFKTAAQSAGFRALNVLSDYVAANGFFATKQDFTDTFKELALTGKIGGSDVAEMAGFTVLDKLKEIEDKSKEVYAIDTWINITRGAGGDFDPVNALDAVGFVVNHTNESGPFSVEVNFTLTFNVSVPDSGTKWVYQNESLIVIFGVAGIQDPLYLEESGYVNDVHATKIEEWTDIDNLSEHFDSMEYNENQDAPSFLMRYYFKASGEFRSELYGIESLVNPNKVAVGDQPKTYADWCFYSTDKCAKDPPFEDAKLWTIDDARFPSEFRLDTKHITRYNAGDYVVEYIVGP